jgi:hypothetical protein
MHSARALIRKMCYLKYSFIRIYSFKLELTSLGNLEEKQLYIRCIRYTTEFSSIPSIWIRFLRKNQSTQWELMLLQKRYEWIKARSCAIGSTQDKFITKEEAANQYVFHEDTMTTGVIKAKQKQYIMTMEFPNLFD